MTDSKLNNIEETLAHQEQQLNDLSDIVVEQGKMIDHLQLQVRGLKAKLDSAQGGDGGGPNPTAGLSISEEAALHKPPHY